MNVLRVKTENGEVYIRQFKAGDVALTGIDDASKILGRNANTIRRYADKGKLETVNLPSGVRRVSTESVLALYEKMYGDVPIILDPRDVESSQIS